jgi:hypothetical protein
MDTQTPAIIEVMQDLPAKEKLKVITLAEYLAWTQRGGPKTAEIKRGEKIYKQLQRKQSHTTNTEYQPFTMRKCP